MSARTRSLIKEMAPMFSHIRASGLLEFYHPRELRRYVKSISVIVKNAIAYKNVIAYKNAIACKHA